MDPRKLGATQLLIKHLLNSDRYSPATPLQPYQLLNEPYTDQIHQFPIVNSSLTVCYDAQSYFLVLSLSSGEGELLILEKATKKISRRIVRGFALDIVTLAITLRKIDQLPVFMIVAGTSRGGVKLFYLKHPNHVDSGQLQKQTNTTKLQEPSNIPLQVNNIQICLTPITAIVCLSKPIKLPNGNETHKQDFIFFVINTENQIFLMEESKLNRRCYVHANIFQCEHFLTLCLNQDEDYLLQATEKGYIGIWSVQQLVRIGHSAMQPFSSHREAEGIFWCQMLGRLVLVLTRSFKLKLLVFEDGISIVLSQILLSMNSFIGGSLCIAPDLEIMSKYEKWTSHFCDSQLGWLLPEQRADMEPQNLHRLSMAGDKPEWRGKLHLGKTPSVPMEQEEAEGVRAIIY